MSIYPYGSKEMSTYYLESRGIEKQARILQQKQRNESMLLQISTTIKVQDHKVFSKSKPRNKQRNHIIIIDNPFEWG